MFSKVDLVTLYSNFTQYFCKKAEYYGIINWLHTVHQMKIWTNIRIILKFTKAHFGDQEVSVSFLFPRTSATIEPLQLFCLSPNNRCVKVKSLLWGYEKQGLVPVKYWYANFISKWWRVRTAIIINLKLQLAMVMSQCELRF